MTLDVNRASGREDRSRSIEPGYARRHATVLSYQLSGVAWAPWRVQQCLASVPSRISYKTAAPCGVSLEAYGLPDVDYRGDIIELIRIVNPSIVQLHHNVVAQGIMRRIRRMAQAPKIIISVHGEPDRTIGIVGPDVPDAYHVVEPDLLRLVGIVGCRISRWIPNHHGRENRVVGVGMAQSSREKVLWVPRSHAGKFKDYDQLRCAAHLLRGNGWSIRCERSVIENDAVLQCLRSAAAVWVQRQGYLDILTMEAMACGVVPCVRLPCRVRSRWNDALGFQAEVADPEDIRDLAMELSLDKRSLMAESNARGMIEKWTAAECGRRWLQLFDEIERMPVLVR